MIPRIAKVLGTAVCMLALALPLAAAPDAAAKKTDEPRSVWPPETLSGRIMMVDPAQHLLIMRGTSGVPFDMTVTNSTTIKMDGRQTTLGNLNSDINREVTVHFVPERAGDIAQTVRVAG